LKKHIGPCLFFVGEALTVYLCGIVFTNIEILSQISKEIKVSLLSSEQTMIVGVMAGLF
jgi:hypothetical protein